MKEIILKKFIPGPGNYESAYSTLVVPPISLKSRVADKSLDHLKKVDISLICRFQVLEHTIMKKLAQAATTSHPSTSTRAGQGSHRAKHSNL